MARMRKGEFLGIMLLGFIAIVVSLISKFFQTFGFIIPLILIAISVAFYIWYTYEKIKEKYEYLENKYGDTKLVEKIMSGSIWVGQTAGQLTDSLGKPVSIDNKILKTKKKEIWKYQHQGGNRFNLRITLENGRMMLLSARIKRDKIKRVITGIITGTSYLIER